MNHKKILIVLILLIQSLQIHATKPAACQGVSKNCTKNNRFDKTIEGQVYSCYECKQTVCKSGGSGPIAGTETSTVCESKAPSGKALVRSQQELQFDEADAVFGKRTEVKLPKSKTGNTGVIYKKKSRTTDHRKKVIDSDKKPAKAKKPSIRDQIIAPNNKNTVDHRTKNGMNKKPKTGSNRPSITQVKMPTNINLYDVTNNSLNISWMDNANNEYGVSIERGTPIKDRGGINYNWQHVFNVEERIDSNVKGIGWRTDSDDNLTANTQYCYRLRSYYKSNYSDYSKQKCVSTTQ